MSADTPRRLGRGLEALISTAKQQRDTVTASSQGEAPPGSDLRRVRLADILPNRFQPRRAFSEPELAELEASIRANGLLQPIVVRAQEYVNFYFVSGERRLRAAKAAGLERIPAVIRQLDEQAQLEVALVENLQR